VCVCVVMRPRSASRGRNTNNSVTFTGVCKNVLRLFIFVTFSHYTLDVVIYFFNVSVITAAAEVRRVRR